MSPRSGADQEGQGGGRDDDVERQEQISLLRSDRDGDPERRHREQGDRDDRRIPSECRCGGPDDENADREGGGVARRADEQLEIRPRDEGRREAGLACRGHSQAGQELSART